MKAGDARARGARSSPGPVWGEFYLGGRGGLASPRDAAAGAPGGPQGPRAR